MQKTSDEMYEDYLYDKMKAECEAMAASGPSTEDMLILADKLNELRDKKKSLDEESKAVSKEIEEIDALLTEAMMENEVEKFSRNKKTFYLSTRLFASALDGNKDALFGALRENGYGDLITETVNANTLSSFVKEQREMNGGEEVPEWLGSVVNVCEKTTVGIRKI